MRASWRPLFTPTVLRAVPTVLRAVCRKIACGELKATQVPRLRSKGRTDARGELACHRRAGLDARPRLVHDLTGRPPGRWALSDL
jgi:hypothetical protein